MPFRRFVISMLFAGMAALGVLAVPSAASAAAGPPMLTAHATPISYGSQDVTFSGDLTQVPDGGGAPIGIAGIEIDLAGQKVATTAADGSYQSDPMPVDPGSYVLTATVDATEVDSLPVPVVVVQDSTKVTAGVTPQHLKYRKKGTLAGTASYQDDSGTHPLASSSVQVTVGTDTATVKTGGSGEFSWPIPTTFGPNWTVVIKGGPLLRTSKASGTMTVTIPLKARRFAARLTPRGSVVTSGCLQITAAHYQPPMSSVRIQYARGAKGPWHALGRLSLRRASGACHGSDESSFAGKLPARLASAYYRADFPGGVHFTTAISKVVHSSLRTTRITPLRVSPRHVPAGSDVLITGRLWKHARAWRPYGHRKVDIIYRFQGKKTWHTLARVATAASGRFHLTFTDGATATLSAVYLGDKTHLRCRGRDIKVTVSGGQTGGPMSPGRIAG